MRFYYLYIIILLFLTLNNCIFLSKHLFLYLACLFISGLSIEGDLLRTVLQMISRFIKKIKYKTLWNYKQDFTKRKHLKIKNT